MIVSESLTSIDFGSNPTNQAVSKEFQLENKGRRASFILWTNEKEKRNKKLTKEVGELETVCVSGEVNSPLIPLISISVRRNNRFTSE